MSEDRHARLERRIKAVLDLTSDRFNDLVHAAGLDPTIELRFGDWHGLDFSRADLRGFDFTGADLTGSRFDDALIAGAIFDRATYDPASLREAADFEAFNKMREHSDKRAIRKEHSDMRATLRDHYLFGKLTPQYIDRLSAATVTKTMKRGANIFFKGDPSTSLFVIRSGTVKISVPSVDGKDAVFNVLGKGAMFGEIGLLDGNPHPTDAIAVTNCELFTIERRDFLPLLREEPEIALRLIEILCSRLRRTTEQAEEFLDLPSRLAKALMRLVEADTAGIRERKITITQKDISNIIGMSRQSTNKQLRIWEDKKWVRLERNAVVILATDHLAAIAGVEGSS